MSSPELPTLRVTPDDGDSWTRLSIILISALYIVLEDKGGELEVDRERLHEVTQLMVNGKVGMALDMQHSTEKILRLITVNLGGEYVN